MLSIKTSKTNNIKVERIKIYKTNISKKKLFGNDS